MAIHTFSTRAKDNEAIAELKQYCNDKGINFSHVVVKALLETETYAKARRRQADQSSTTGRG